MMIITAPGPVYHGPFHQFTAFTGWGGVRSGKYLAVAYTVSPFCKVADTTYGDLIDVPVGAVDSGATGGGVSWCAQTGQLAVVRTDAVVIYEFVGRNMVEQRRFTTPLASQTKSVLAAQYSPDGSKLAITSSLRAQFYDGTAQAYLTVGDVVMLDSLSYSVLGVILSVAQSAGDLYWSPDGQKIAFTTSSNYLHVASLADFSIRFTKQVNTSFQGPLKWSMDSKRALFGVSWLRWFKLEMYNWPEVYDYEISTPGGEGGWVPDCPVPSTFFATSLSVIGRFYAFGADERIYALEYWATGGTNNHAGFTKLQNDWYLNQSFMSGAVPYNSMTQDIYIRDISAFDGQSGDFHLFSDYNIAAQQRSYSTLMCDIKMWLRSHSYTPRADGQGSGTWVESGAFYTRPGLVPEWPFFYDLVASPNYELFAASYATASASWLPASAWHVLIFNLSGILKYKSPPLSRASPYAQPYDQGQPYLFWTPRGSLGYLASEVLHIVDGENFEELSTISVPTPQSLNYMQAPTIGASFSPYIPPPP